MAYKQSKNKKKIFKISFMENIISDAKVPGCSIVHPLFSGSCRYVCERCIFVLSASSLWCFMWSPEVA